MRWSWAAIALFALAVPYGAGAKRPHPHYTLILPDKYVGWVQVIFNDRKASPFPHRKDGGYQVDVPETGIARTSDMHVIDSTAKDEFYYRSTGSEGNEVILPVPFNYVLPGVCDGGFTMMNTDGKGPGSSWYVFIGPPELRATVPDAVWVKKVEDYAKAHGGKTRIESSGPYPVPGRMPTAIPAQSH
jgi:hypothetical protein